MINGKAKGDAFENKVAKLLASWLYPVEGDYKGVAMQDLPFRRRFTTGIPLEGHWNGQGDILHKPGYDLPFCVECKKHEGWDIDGYFHSKNWVVWDWWEQAKEQADKVNKPPLLIFTRNRKKIYILIQEGVVIWKQKEHKGISLANGSERLRLTTLTSLTEFPLCLSPVQKS